MMSGQIKEDIFQVNYDQNHILSRCDDIILEAKRVLLHEQLNTITNITLAEVNNSRKKIENCFKQCKDSLNWKNELFWKELPSPEKSLKKRNEKKDEDNSIENRQVVDNVLINDLIKHSSHKIFQPKVNNDGLLEKYFNIWKEVVKLKNEEEKLSESKIEQKEKLNKLIKNLKCRKEEQTKYKKRESSEISEQLNPPCNYKNRFIAQQNIINMQKAKLEEQNKLIGELKLGIIREDLLKSLENTKINISEIFSSCSERVKCRAPILFVEENQKFMISTQKAPKIIQQMEQKALERAQNRQIILERKHIIEETRQRMLEEAIEKKRVLEEDERKQNLKLIKDRQKKELEQEKIRQANKQKYLENLSKAVNFYRKLLIRHCFKELYNNFRTCRNNRLIAIEHYEMHILKKTIYCWCNFVEQKYKEKYDLADAHFAYKILKKVLKNWHEFYVESLRNMQVAEDVYDFRLSSNTFSHWHRYVCTQIILQDKQMKMAENHYKRGLVLFHCPLNDKINMIFNSNNFEPRLRALHVMQLIYVYMIHRRILLQYYYQWRSLPAVIQLEKAKELKKQKWREKVWEILPDYKPPEDV